MSFIDGFQEQVWKDKYQYKNENYEEFCENPKKFYDEFTFETRSTAGTPLKSK